MNKTYRVIWNESSQAWVAVPEFAKARGKRGRTAVAAAVVLGLTGFASSAVTASTTPCGTNDCSNVIYTPETANNGGMVFSIDDTDNYNLNTAVLFRNAVGYSFQDMNIRQLYNAGYATGSIDPSSVYYINLGGATTGITVTDPNTNVSSAIKTYNSSSFSLALDNNGHRIYMPTPAGGGQFYDSGIAAISGGGTFNMNATGVIGSSTAKNTIFVNITNGTANWNSSNTVTFANMAPSSEVLQPYVINLNNTVFSGSFSVRLSDGSSVNQTVNNMADLQAYNSWLQQQLAAGKLGAGNTAQNNYNNALSLAYSNQILAYQVTPPTIASDDSLLAPLGNQIVIYANGTNALGHVSSSGALSADNLSGALMLRASNGGTIINDGAITVKFGNTGAMAADSGGHIINNGLEVKSATNTSRDSYTGNGTTLNNYGTVNLDGVGNYNTSPTWLQVNNGATATNNGAVNWGGTIDASNATANTAPSVVYISSGGTFINAGAAGSSNGYAGVIYLGRAASKDITSDPLLRGGSDVNHAFSESAIKADSDSTVVNDGNIIIGSGMQQSYGIFATGTNVNVTVGKDGVITDNGNYPVAAGNAPLRNAAIYSNATSGIVNNGGTINLNGANGTGLYTFGGGIASSSGT
ncbi:hypothetical protein GTGU_04336, partial [Trabulsiella guamensis ATCC 49490]